MAAIDHLAITLLDVVLDQKEAVDVCAEADAADRRAARSPRRRAEDLLAHPGPLQPAQALVVLVGLRHSLHDTLPDPSVRDRGRSASAAVTRRVCACARLPTEVATAG